ncbi:RNA-dependent RNA polymerase [Botrytis cinerea mycovirus 3]|nr:RNA-dependent RNA polymerase [Botrytis cinerea mycovirus 3]
MSKRALERAFKGYEDSSEGGTTQSSFASASPSTKRRKQLRRMQASSRETKEVETLTKLFTHMKVLGRVDAYGQLNKDLVIAPPDPEVASYTLEHPPPIPGFKAEEWTFVKACTPVEMAHLRHFDRPNHTPDECYTPSIEKAALVVADLLSLDKYLLFPDLEDLATVKYYPKKFAGIEYAVMGLKTRAEADPIAQIDAENAWEKLMKGERVAPHDVRLGGRGKITRMDTTEAEAKVPAVGRLILMMSQRDLKLCGVTEGQLTAAYLDPKYPIAVGQSWFHQGSQDFIDRLVPYERYYCFDAKKFDSSINEWMVRLAVNILRRQYLDGMNEIYDAYWEFIIESLLRPPIYRDDGIRMQKFVGTTSGHSHNTLIQSIITLLIGYAALFELDDTLTPENIQEHAWLESLGDDNIMGVSSRLAHLTTEDIAKCVQDMVRVDWWGKKSFSTTCLLDAMAMGFEGVQFLGKYWYLGEYPSMGGAEKVPIPYRPAIETYLRLLYPEHGNLTVMDTYLRCLGNYIDAAGNQAMESWLQGLMDYVEPRVGEAPTEWPPNFKRMVSRDYSNVGVEVPKPRRMEFQQWRDLVVLPRGEYRRVWGAKEIAEDLKEAEYGF